MEATKIGMHVVSANHYNTVEGTSVRDINMKNINVSIGGRAVNVNCNDVFNKEMCSTSKHHYFTTISSINA